MAETRNAKHEAVTSHNPALTTYQRQSILIDCDKTFHVDPALNLQATHNDLMN